MASLGEASALHEQRKYKAAAELVSPAVLAFACVAAKHTHHAVQALYLLSTIHRDAGEADASADAATRALALLTPPHEFPARLFDLSCSEWRDLSIRDNFTTHVAAADVAEAEALRAALLCNVGMAHSRAMRT